jgi:hypothetical protein
MQRKILILQYNANDRMVFLLVGDIYLSVLCALCGEWIRRSRPSQDENAGNRPGAAEGVR